MKKLICAAVCTVAFVGIVMADEFTAQITKVDGNTIHFKKGFGFGGGGKKGGGGGGGEAAKEESAKATADVKVAKGEVDFAGGGGGGKKGGGGGGKGLNVKAGDPIEKGLKDEMFTKIEEGKSVNAQITTNDKGEVTQVLVIQGFGGGKKGGKKG